MNSVDCLDLETRKAFTKEFTNVYEQKKFIVKCRHSKKIMVIGYACYDSEEMEYLER